MKKEYVHDFFDPENKEHLKAYKHLIETGCWPKGFIKENIEFGPTWHHLVVNKIAMKYIEKELG